MLRINKLILVLLFLGFVLSGNAENRVKDFKVIAFYTAKNDKAHISFVNEANLWFSKMSVKHHFSYEPTNDWSKLNTENISQYQVVIFLDTRPELAGQRNAFQKYMENGGAFMGFHFSAFTLSNSDFPQNWDWYHNQFLGCGEYKGNTWRPTSAILKVEDRNHFATRHLPSKFKSQPNEWYSWQNDITQNPDIKVLLSIDSSSFPVGTGPKPHEIWHSGYYPVVWTNTKYRMIYINMGHNDIDYEHKTNKELSFTFTNKIQNKLILDALDGLGGKNVKNNSGSE